MFSEEKAEELLSGNPSYVLDCIDDANTKISLISYCLNHKIPILSSLGAAAKIDPTKVYIGNLQNVRSIFYLFNNIRWWFSK